MARLTKRVPHIMKAPKTATYPSNVMFFDTETKAEINPDCLSESFHRLWFGFSLAFRYEDGKRTRIKTTRFETPKQFWDTVKCRLDKKRPLYIFAHNLSFDLTIVDFWELGEKLGLELKYAVLEGPPTMVHCTWNDCPLYFVDTLNFWRESLLSIGESVGMDKLAMPNMDNSKEVWDTYCLRDCEVLATAVTGLFNFIKQNDLGSFAITIASLAFNAFKHKFMKTEIFVHDNEKVLALERESYHGGLVHCFYIGEVNDKKTYHLDVNSLYPYCMLNPVPVKHMFKYANQSIKTAKSLMETYGSVADVTLDSKDEVFPIYTDHKLIDAKGTFRTVLCGPELERAINTGSVKRIHDISYYKMAVIFKDYVEYFYNLRMKYPKKDNPVVNRFAKLLMNSLYGKFGQLGYDWIELTQSTLETLYMQADIPFPEYYRNKNSAPDINWGQHIWQPKNYPEPLQIRCINGQLQFKQIRGEHYESCPIIASYITGYAREHLRKLIAIAGKRQVYYCDTDSLFTTRTGMASLRKGGWIDDTRLGYLKLEGQSRRSAFYCPKDYIFGDKVVIKGISGKAIQIGEAEYIQNQFEGLKSILKRSRDAYIKVSWVVKKNKRVYTKALILNDGWTEHFTLSDGVTLDV